MYLKLVSKKEDERYYKFDSDCQAIHILKHHSEELKMVPKQRLGQSLCKRPLYLIFQNGYDQEAKKNCKRPCDKQTSSLTAR